VSALLVGLAFGWLLHRARLGRYETVVNVFRFTDLTVVKFLVSALLVAALGVQSLESLGLACTVPVARTYVAGNLVGGLLFGAGMALAGFCPGTVAAGAGEGRLDYLVPGTLGLLAGALAFGFAYPAFPALAAIGDAGSITAPAALGVDGWLLVALLWEVGLLVVYALERRSRRPACGANPAP
jgi:uncharacterized membrane protein YedE/YeeE